MLRQSPLLRNSGGIDRASFLNMLQRKLVEMMPIIHWLIIDIGLHRLNKNYKKPRPAIRLIFFRVIW